MEKTKNAISKNTMRTTIRKYIQRMISSGELRPGDRIVETRLAKELSVSQAPVREAILELSSMGLLEERPYSGTFVRKLSAQDIEDIYSIRAFIEEYAAKRAAKNRTEGQLSQMREALCGMEAAANYDELVPFDMRFHELVMEAAHSPALKQVWETLRMAEWTYTSTLVTHLSPAELTDIHRTIFGYIEKGADHSAGACMFLHIKSFTDEMIGHLTRAEQGEELKEEKA